MIRLTRGAGAMKQLDEWPRHVGGRWWLARFSAAWMLVVGLFVGSGRADVSGTLVLPLPGETSPPSGIRLRISNFAPEGYGYRPISVEAVCRPVNRDRRLRIDILPNSWNDSYESDRTTGYLDIPAGSTRASMIIPVLQYLPWYTLRIEVFEGDKPIRDLTMRQGWTGNQRSNWHELGAIPAALLIDSDAPRAADRETAAAAMSAQTPTHHLPDISSLAALFPVNTSPRVDLLLGSSPGQRTSDFFVLQALRQSAHVDMRPPEELPRSWTAYSQFDFILLDLDEWEALGQSHPEVQSAIRDAVAMGANLIVWDVGRDFDRLEALSASLGIPAHRTSGAEIGWKSPNASEFGRQFVEAFTRAGATAWDRVEAIADDYGAAEYAIDYSAGYPSPELTPPDPSQSGVPANSTDSDMPAISLEGLTPGKPPEGPPPFVIAPLGLGRVAAIGDEELYHHADLKWDWLLNSINEGEQFRTLWAGRHGLNLRSGTPEFWEFLIPEVGAAPVKTFLGMITLFAVVIGPVNYWVLRRAKKLYLLLVTVPLGAAVVSLSMMVFGVVNDGFGTLVRVRSFTYLDRGAGKLQSWSRQAYYSGLAPSGGLQFPSGTIVYPIQPQGYELSSVHRHMIWDNGLTLAAGYLQSRSLAQFLVLHQSESSADLQVHSGEQLEATNRLGVDLERLVLLDEQNQFWVATSVAHGSRVELRKVDRQSELAYLRRLLADARPQPPAGLDPQALGQNSFFGMRFYYSPTYSSVAFAGNTMEMSINSMWMWDEDQHPRTFVAITRQRPPSVPLGIRAAGERESFHMIYGSW